MSLEQRVLDLLVLTELTKEQIKKKMSLDFYLSWERTEEILNQVFTSEEHQIRTKALLHKGSLGKIQETSSRWTSPRRMQGGYWLILCPKWYSGNQICGRVAEHIVVYCEANGLTEVPEGYVVHHIDLDKLNNIPSNLQLMTISDHMKLHRKLQEELRHLNSRNTG